MSSGGGAPEPDPLMGEAALLAAQTGGDMLDYMKSQAAITNKWAADDRSRQQSVFQPIEDQYIADAQAANDPTKIGLKADARASEAIGDVRQQFSLQRDADNRRQRSMGVRPDSGQSADLAMKQGSAEALAAAGAGNIARRQSVAESEAEGESMRANVLNAGRGMAVNPATSMGLSSNAAVSGFSGAQQGYGQQANILGQQYAGQMDAWNADQGMLGSLGGALGTVAGAFISSKEVKENKRPATDSLGAVRKMPVEQWKYKDGVADSDEHIGPYAEDFQKATGQGDGKSIDPITLAGLTLGAVRELDEKVSKMERKKSA